MRALFAAALLALAACGDDPAPAAPSLGPDGIAPFRIGMTLEELHAAFGMTPPEGVDPGACLYIDSNDGPQLALMIQDGILQRIEAREAVVPLEHGLHLGDPAAKVHAAYGDKVEVQPHKYDYETGAQYLTIFTPDKKRAIRYITDGTKITAAHAGNAEAVQLVEGCG
jgi:hypothetical protein